MRRCHWDLSTWKKRECILWIANQEFCHINVKPWIILRSEGKKLHHRYNLLVKRKALCCNSNGNKYGLENEEISVGCSMHSHPLIPCLDTMLWSQVWNAFLVEFDRQEEELPFLIHNSSHWIWSYKQIYKPKGNTLKHHAHCKLLVSQANFGEKQKKKCHKVSKLIFAELAVGLIWASFLQTQKKLYQGPLSNGKTIIHFNSELNH